MGKVNKTLLLLAAIMLAASFMFFFQAGQKLRFHEDEIMTYCLANSQTYGSINTPLMQQVNASEMFMDAMTVHPDGRFNFAQVWSNQAGDVHPPLYYVVIHFLCSCIPDTFSVWTGFGVNLFFFLLCILLVYQCAGLMYKDKRCSLIITAFFALCPAMMEISVFIRMYMMGMFFCLLMLKWFLTHLDEHRLKLSAYIALFIPVVLGALTHYYCILFSVLFSISFGIWQIKKKHTFKLIWFSVTMILSAATAICIFPSMLSHIFSGYRGTEAFGNALQLGNFFYRNLVFFQMADADIFGGTTIILMILSIVLMKKKREPVKALFLTKKAQRLHFVLAPTLVFFLIVSKTAAFLDTRYISPIYPCLVLCGIGILLTLINRYATGKKAKRLTVGILLFMLVAGYLWCDWGYSYKYGQKVLDIAEEYSDNHCLFVYDDGLWMADRHMQELDKFQSTTFVPVDKVRLLPVTDTDKEDSFVAFIALFSDAEPVAQEILSVSPNVNAYKPLYNWNHSCIYYFYNE